MKMLCKIPIILLALMVASCGSPRSRDWKTVVDEKGNTILMDPMMQDVLEAKKPNPTQKSLDAMLARITRIRVMDAGMSGSDLVVLTTNKPAQAEVLLDTNDKAQIAKFRDMLKIVEDTNTLGHCMCLGWPTLEFYSGDHLISRIGMQHGCGIRWEAWKWDVFLKDNVALLDWCAANGAPQPKKSYEADLASAAEQNRDYKKWMAAMPKGLEPVWESSVDQFGETNIKALRDALATSMPKKTDQILALLTWFGSGEGPWSGFPSYETAAENLLLEYKVEDIFREVNIEKLTSAQMEGAARLFGGWEFSQKYPDGLKQIPDSVKKALWKHVKDTKDKDKLGRAKYAFMGIAE